MQSPLIYNLFPRLAGHMDQWLAHTQRARDMAFDWIFINPVQYPGFSGSLYAVKDFYRLNPLFVPPGCDDPMECLRRTIDEMHGQGLRVCMDLVINHTAKDSGLIEEHPGWFRRNTAGSVVSPSAIDPADARQVTVWGDLAEVDNAESSDREGLWAYWSTLVEYYLDLGFDGFRCDAAYKVPAELWDRLIGAARAKNPDVVFLAETLGCRLPEVRKLEASGFDYLFNSSKWWNFDAPWCLSQHEEFRGISPSISFPESHDTPRLMQETGGLIQVQKMRYAFASLFASGLLMPIGYEFGFAERVNVCDTTPGDWEETDHDLQSFITKINGLRSSIEVMGLEGRWQLVSSYDQPTIVLCKTDDALDHPVLVVINKDWTSPQRCELPAMDQILPGPSSILRLFSGEPHGEPFPDGPMNLDPAEVALVVPDEQ